MKLTFSEARKLSDYELTKLVMSSKEPSKTKEIALEEMYERKHKQGYECGWQAGADEMSA